MSNSSYFESLVNLHKQFSQSYKETHKFKPDFDLQNVREIIIAGMGGSIFGGKVIQEAFYDSKLQAPLYLISGYDLPEYADEKTLVIATSYSGETEEIIEIINQAKSKGCMIIGITSGGMLEKLIKKKSIEGYVFKPKFNTAKAPRTGIGYIIGATIGILSALHFLDYNNKEVEDVSEFIKNFTQKIIKDEKIIDQMSLKIGYKIPVFIGAEHLKAGTYIWRNFLNETAKYCAFNEVIPDMNHHFLDGLYFPEQVHDKLIFIFVFSELYNFRNKKRFKISRDVMKKQDVLSVGLILNGGEKLKEIFELIIIGAFVSLNLANHNKVNPATNEMVDYLKKELNS